MAKKVIKILFPGLTHKGKMYNVGDIELEPSPYLIEAAKNKTKQLHKDSGRNIRLCKFVNVGEEYDDDFLDDIDDDKPKREPAQFVGGGYDDDLTDMQTPELIVIAGSLGMNKKKLKDFKMDDDKIRSIITFLRKA